MSLVMRSLSRRSNDERKAYRIAPKNLPFIFYTSIPIPHDVQPHMNEEQNPEKKSAFSHFIGRGPGCLRSAATTSTGNLNAASTGQPSLDQGENVEITPPTFTHPDPQINEVNKMIGIDMRWECPSCGNVLRTTSPFWDDKTRKNIDKPKKCACGQKDKFTLLDFSKCLYTVLPKGTKIIDKEGNTIVENDED